MSNLQILSEIELATERVWQGKGIDVDKIIEQINAGVQDILSQLSKLQQNGIDFPMEYVTSAMKNLSVALQQRDDYLLADNLYFEWREIFAVYEEVLAEL